MIQAWQPPQQRLGHKARGRTTVVFGGQPLATKAVVLIYAKLSKQRLSC